MASTAADPSTMVQVAARAAEEEAELSPLAPLRTWKPAAREPSLRSAEQSAVLPVVLAPNSLNASGESPPANDAQAASQVTPAGAGWKMAPRRSAAEAVREGSVFFFFFFFLFRERERERKS